MLKHIVRMDDLRVSRHFDFTQKGHSNELLKVHTVWTADAPAYVKLL
jgi:hypothetical protein